MNMRQACVYLLAASGLSGTAHAVDPESLSQRADLWGNWDGVRDVLARQGVSFNLGYSSETAYNAQGGNQRLLRYTDQWVLGSTLDLQKLMGWTAGTFQLIYTHRAGRNLSDDAGLDNLQQVQELYGRGQTWRLTQLWVDQALWQGRVQWKLGRMTVGEDFANFSCDFQNLTFCGSQPGNIAGSYWYNWPVSQWGTRIKLNTSSDSYAQIGLYQVNPTYADDHYAHSHGWQPDNPDGTQGALILLEVAWLPAFAGMPGSYKLGGWYNSAGGPDLYLNSQGQSLALDGGSPLQHSSRRGVYANLSQQVTGESSKTGAVVFLNVSAADRDTTADDHQIALGMEYRAPFDRVQDMIGFALGATHVNGRVTAYQTEQAEVQLMQVALPAAQRYEYVAEIFYRWAVIPSINLQPNLQYIHHPGGRDVTDDVVLGLRTGITF